MNRSSSSLLRLSALDMDPKHRSNIPCLVCALMASLTTGGTNYAFSVYAGALKHDLHLTQDDLETISTAFYFSGLLTWIPGIMTDRLGTRVSLCAGGTFGAIILFAYWVIARQFVVLDYSVVVPTLSFLGFMIFMAMGMIVGSVFKIIVGCCSSKSKGAVVGVAKGLVGLGAGTYSCIFHSMQQPDQSDIDFLFMAAAFALLVVSLPAIFLLPSKEEMNEIIFRDDLSPRHIRILYIGITSLGLVLVGKSLSELIPNREDDDWTKDETTSHESQHWMPDTGLCMFLLMAWLGPIISLLYLPQYDNQTNDDLTEASERVGVISGVATCINSSIVEDETEAVQDYYTEGVVNEGSYLLTDLEKSSSISYDSPIKIDEVDTLIKEVGVQQDDNFVQPQMNLMQMLQTPVAWLMLYTTTIVVGSGSVEISNMAQMTEALEFNSKVTPASLALFSVCQAAGRVITGAVSDDLILSRGVPRPFFLFVSVVLGLCAQLILGWTSHETGFVLGIALTGVAFGMVWPMIVLIIGDLYGNENLGANYLLYDGFTLAVGTFVLSKFLAEPVYEAHIDPEISPDENTCIGKDCFRLTHIITAVALVSCLFTSGIMLYKTRNIYERLSASRRRQSSQ